MGAAGAFGVEKVWAIVAGLRVLGFFDCALCASLRMTEICGGSKADPPPLAKDDEDYMYGCVWG